MPELIDYNIHVKPIFSDRCFTCHGPDKANQKAGLALFESESAYSELKENPGISPSFQVK
ncbi:MAG: mono/diheme cytochrome c family protein [Saprospiraceae bacterium]|jgi:mono/diheme cytochrome c family protein